MVFNYNTTFSGSLQPGGVLRFSGVFPLISPYRTTLAYPIFYLFCSFDVQGRHGGGLICQWLWAATQGGLYVVCYPIWAAIFRATFCSVGLKKGFWWMYQGFIPGFNEVGHFLTYGVFELSLFWHFVLIVEVHPDGRVLILHCHSNVWYIIDHRFVGFRGLVFLPYSWEPLCWFGCTLHIQFISDRIQCHC